MLFNVLSKRASKSGCIESVISSYERFSKSIAFNLSNICFTVESYEVLNDFKTSEKPSGVTTTSLKGFFGSFSIILFLNILGRSESIHF